MGQIKPWEKGVNTIKAWPLNLLPIFKSFPVIIYIHNKVI